MNPCIPQECTMHAIKLILHLNVCPNNPLLRSEVFITLHFQLQYVLLITQCYKCRTVQEASPLSIQLLFKLRAISTISSYGSHREATSWYRKLHLSVKKTETQRRTNVMHVVCTAVEKAHSDIKQ